MTQSFLSQTTSDFSPRLIPETKMEAYKRPAKTLPRSENGEDGHEKNWIEACKSGKPADCNFDYAGPFTESVVMGNLSLRALYEVLEWDGRNMRFTR